MNNPHLTGIHSILFMGWLTANAVIAQPAAPETAAPPPAVFDFEKLPEGPLPEDFAVLDADAVFRIVAEGTAGSSNHVLELSPQPLVEGGVLAGPSIKGAATVMAGFHATGTRRSFPRFGLGLHGAGGFRLLMVPAMKELQLVRDDAVVARIPMAWKSATWVKMEFSILAAAEGAGSLIEGRVWEAGATRPDLPQLSHTVTAPPGTGRASLWATPFSATPIRFDDVEIRPRP